MNLSKQFEARFKKDWIRCFPESFIYRLNDQITGFKYTSSNISDFIGYVYPNLYIVELKTHKGASLPFNKITQYDKLVKELSKKGVRVGIVLWLYEKDIVMYIPVSTIKQMKKENKKSVGLKALKDGYNIKIIPSEKLITFMKSDYSCLYDLKDGE